MLLPIRSQQLDRRPCRATTVVVLQSGSTPFSGFHGAQKQLVGPGFLVTHGRIASVSNALITTTPSGSGTEADIWQRVLIGHRLSPSFRRSGMRPLSSANGPESGHDCNDVHSGILVPVMLRVGEELWVRILKGVFDDLPRDGEPKRGPPRHRRQAVDDTDGRMPDRISIEHRLLAGGVLATRRHPLQVAGREKLHTRGRARAYQAEGAAL